MVVYGDVEYCYNPCNENNTASDNCNWCDPESNLILDFERYQLTMTVIEVQMCYLLRNFISSLDTVMFDDLILSPAARRSQRGGSVVRIRNVSHLAVSGGQYDQVREY